MISHAETQLVDHEVSIPTDYYKLPAVGSSIEDHLAEIVAGFTLDADTSARLLHGLRSLTTLAHSTPSGPRTDWALILSPSSGRVDALLTLKLFLQTEDSKERYLSDANSVEKKLGNVELIRRLVSERDLPAGPAVVVVDLVLPGTEGGIANPAAERSAVALFPTQCDKVLEFTMLTQDLRLFEDAGEYLVCLASEVRAKKVAG